MSKSKNNIFILIAIVVFSFGAKNVYAQTNNDISFIPLIGITSVPEPLALPKGSGKVTYHYAVKNFLKEIPLVNVSVVDDKCNHVKFIEGDDNNNSNLDYNETWRYSCTTTLFETTRSTATATGTAHGIIGTDQASATVIINSNNPAPLVSIVNITKIAYPLSLPPEGGQITFTYKVNNPGTVPLNNISVSDDACGAMSGKLGDTNNNNLLDINEVWIYTCTTTLKQTTTNTATVTAFYNGLQANDSATLTVKVGNPIAQSSPNFPNEGALAVNSNFKTIVWIILSIILAALIIFFIFKKSKK